METGAEFVNIICGFLGRVTVMVVSPTGKKDSFASVVFF